MLGIDSDTATERRGYNNEWRLGTNVATISCLTYPNTTTAIEK